MVRLLGAYSGVALGVIAALAGPVRASAQEADPVPPSTAFALRASIKASALLFRTPDAGEVFPARAGGESLWRVRVEPEVTTTRAVFAFAYEQRLRYTSSVAGPATVSILPSSSAAPFRIRPLDWHLSGSSGFEWRHEVDRAHARLHFHRADVTVGRQAIGWGRGVMFGAVDLFAPFSPLEADREWRRGVDAVRTDLKLTNRSSLDIVGAFGDAWSRSALAVRARGYAGPIDVELMGGRRARDVFTGVTSSAAVGDAELHGELAAFHVPGELPGGSSHVVWKAVAGGSYRFPIGSGIMAYAEYHYSGFGAPRPADMLRLLAAPGFTERYLRGDTQILSRHAAAVIASYQASPELTYAGQWVVNPRDRSGVSAPSLTFTPSDQVSLLATAYVPFGRPPRGGVLRSEYGAASLTALLQMRVYF